MDGKTSCHRFYLSIVFSPFIKIKKNSPKKAKNKIDHLDKKSSKKLV
jgi:hypothetical protein